MENIKPNKKRFDIMDYFSVMRIGAALLLSIYAFAMKGAKDTK